MPPHLIHAGDAALLVWVIGEISLRCGAGIGTDAVAEYGAGLSGVAGGKAAEGGNLCKRIWCQRAGNRGRRRGAGSGLRRCGGAGKGRGCEERRLGRKCQNESGEQRCGRLPQKRNVPAGAIGSYTIGFRISCIHEFFQFIQGKIRFVVSQLLFQNS